MANPKNSTKKSRVTKVITPKNSNVEVKLVKPKNKRKKQTAKNIQVVSGFERYKMIEVAAYYLAEKNGFAGSAADYWIDAEIMIDAKVAAEHGGVMIDKLTRVEGIGPKIAELLTNAGIATFADLARAEIATLSGILAEAGPRYAMHKPDSWPQQAALARDDKMDELDLLQDQLKGGRI
jgi:predicted flap endonuclease-1-like 5' DNA nuclease